MQASPSQEFSDTLVHARFLTNERGRRRRRAHPSIEPQGGKKGTVCGVDHREIERHRLLMNSRPARWGGSRALLDGAICDEDVALMIIHARHETTRMLASSRRPASSTVMDRGIAPLSQMHSGPCGIVIATNLPLRDHSCWSLPV